jgi:hypothetical protein
MHGANPGSGAAGLPLGQTVRHRRLHRTGCVQGIRSGSARPYLVHWEGEHATRFSACAGDELEPVDEPGGRRVG